MERRRESRSVGIVGRGCFRGRRRQEESRGEVEEVEGGGGATKRRRGLERLGEEVGEIAPERRRAQKLDGLRGGRREVGGDGAGKYWRIERAPEEQQVQQQVRLREAEVRHSAGAQVEQQAREREREQRRQAGPQERARLVEPGLAELEQPLAIQGWEHASRQLAPTCAVRCGFPYSLALSSFQLR